MSPTKRDHRYASMIVCPYEDCSWESSDSWEYEAGEVDCPQRERTFDLTIDVIHEFTTEPRTPSASPVRLDDTAAGETR